MFGWLSSRTRAISRYAVIDTPLLMCFRRFTATESRPYVRNIYADVTRSTRPCVPSPMGSVSASVRFAAIGAAEDARGATSIKNSELHAEFSCCVQPCSPKKTQGALGVPGRNNLLAGRRSVNWPKKDRIVTCTSMATCPRASARSHRCACAPHASFAPAPVAPLRPHRASRSGSRTSMRLSCPRM